MNGIAKAAEVVGTVVRIDVTGFGINSGEITLVIAPDSGGGVVEVFGGILPSDPPAPNDPSWRVRGLEHGVFAAYVSVATTAYTSGAKIFCRYEDGIDKPRITGLSLRS